MIKSLDFSDIAINAEDLKARALRVFRSTPPPTELIVKIRQWEKRWKKANFSEYTPHGLLGTPQTASSYQFGGWFDSLLSLVDFVFKQGESASCPLPKGYSFRDLAYAAIMIQATDHRGDRNAVKRSREFLEELEKANIKKEAISVATKWAAGKKRNPEIDTYLAWLIGKSGTRSPTNLWKSMKEDFSNREPNIRKIFDDYEDQEDVFYMKKSFKKGSRTGEAKPFKFEAFKKRLRRLGT